MLKFENANANKYYSGQCHNWRPLLFYYKHYSLLGGDDLGPLQHGGGAALVRDHAVVSAVEVGVLRKYLA